ncbi:hypothetical protein GOV09_04270 [Candidatus Woesearchaeota archaeon]|nr:hypothetical protein [Candidatus Woesearchaeota archaeon]
MRHIIAALFLMVLLIGCQAPEEVMEEPTVEEPVEPEPEAEAADLQTDDDVFDTIDEALDALG